MSDGYTVRRYLTDDRDQPRKYELVVMHAPNGDFYIGSVLEGSAMTTGVRICTSGGAASRNPRLLRAVREIFMALGGWENNESHEPAEEELVFQLALKHQCSVELAREKAKKAAEILHLDLLNALTFLTEALDNTVWTANDNGDSS